MGDYSYVDVSFLRNNVNHGDQPEDPTELPPGGEERIQRKEDNTQYRSPTFQALDYDQDDLHNKIKIVMIAAIGIPGKINKFLPVLRLESKLYASS